MECVLISGCHTHFSDLQLILRLKSPGTGVDAAWPDCMSVTLFRTKLQSYERDVNSFNKYYTIVNCVDTPSRALFRMRHERRFKDQSSTASQINVAEELPVTLTLTISPVL